MRDRCDRDEQLVWMRIRRTSWRLRRREAAAASKFAPSGLRQRLILCRHGERDDTAGPSLHDGRDPFRHAVGDGAERVVLQMGVVLGSSGLTMAEHLANEIEAVAAGYVDRGEAVSKIVYPADPRRVRRNRNAASVCTAPVQDP